MVRLRICTSTTFCAAGMVLVSPQKPLGSELADVVAVALALVVGPEVPVYTWNSHSE